MGYRPELVERCGPLFSTALFLRPLLNLITLHRILDAGIRPHAILLEVWPPPGRNPLNGPTPSRSMSIDCLERSTGPDTLLPSPELYKNWIVNGSKAVDYRYTHPLFARRWLTPRRARTVGAACTARLAGQGTLSFPSAVYDRTCCIPV